MGKRIDSGGGFEMNNQKEITEKFDQLMTLTPKQVEALLIKRNPFGAYHVTKHSKEIDIIVLLRYMFDRHQVAQWQLTRTAKENVK